MKLYGTTTSPYVRRVRIIARELGLNYTRTDTATDAGQAELRVLSPIWKVPVWQTANQVIWDSHKIIDWLFGAYGTGQLYCFPADDYNVNNFMTAVDGALDSGINLFYLQKDGLAIDQSAYMRKQQDRIHASLQWLEQNLTAGLLAGSRAYSYPGIVLVSSIDWMQFRQAADLNAYPTLRKFAHDMNDQHAHIRATSPA
ncbi:MAG: glutathione S-transferase family protein [Leptospiraceae bacterium]|nr:glutathione S-transferase family protein [Leptospiraceae bacterium]